MQCPECQRNNPGEARFCLGCGTRFVLVCRSCGTELPGDACFCLQCGQSVAGRGTSNHSLAPQTYTPKHLADRILTSRAALEGEHKQVTVLIADLERSMELLADRDPDDARKFIDPVLEHMMEAVHRYEGTVNQVMGDGIMAIFGAPLALEDHAVRACYAALRMQDSVKRYAEGMRRQHGVEIRVRVGLNSGEVVVRSIGSDLRMDYSAIGQTMRLAARMEQSATPGTILMAAPTVALTGGYLDVRGVGPMFIQGLAELVETYELVAANAVRSRLHAIASRGLTPFVGRVAELEQLTQSLELAGLGHGQVVAVQGEPGVGKSRLYWEFTHSRRPTGWLVLESRSSSYGQATSYLPVVDLLKVYFQIDDCDDTRKIREKVLGKVLSLDQALEPWLAPILSLLDVPHQDFAWDQLDPVQRRERTLEAVKRLLLRESQVQPLIVLCEDLHQIDAETQALLDNVVTSLPAARVLLLVSYRPEYRHGWSNKTYYRQLRIDPLPLHSSEELLTFLLGSDASLEHLRSTLIERTEGNPLFLEESVQALVEMKILTGERGGYRLARDVPLYGFGQDRTMPGVPVTIQAILAARIDRLPPEEKDLLQTAAVIGKDVPFDLLSAIVEEPEPELRARLGNLQRAELLYEARLFPNLEYAFKHALTAEVAYTNMLHERRRQLHEKTIRAIERMHRDRIDDHVARLAHHALHAERWEDLARYGHLAGRRAVDRLALMDGIQHFRDALRALDHLDPTPAHLRQGIALRLSLRAPLWHTGQPDEVLIVLREAERLARDVGDTHAMDQVTVLLSNILWGMGRHLEGQELIPGLRRTAANELDLRLRTFALRQLGYAHFAVGECQALCDLLLPQLDMAAKADSATTAWVPGTSAPSVSLRTLLVGAHIQLGNFDEALRHGEDGIARARALDHPLVAEHSEMLVATWLSWCHGQRGSILTSLELSKKVIAFSERQGAMALLIHAVIQHGWDLCAVGQCKEGVPMIEKGLTLAQTHRVLYFQCLWLYLLAQAHLWNKDPVEAAAVASRVMELAPSMGEVAYLPWGQYMAGEAAAARESPTVASANYGAALTTAESQGMRPLVAHCHAGLANLYRTMGRRSDADTHARIATTMYDDMGMTFWREKFEQPPTAAR
jgi:class 3 adenylate cyclase